MAGTKAGGQKAAATNKAKYGAEFYRKIGGMGERATGHKFAYGKLDPVETGKLGGAGKHKKRKEIVE